MPSQYVVQQKATGYCDVLFRQLFSAAELQARLLDLLKNGWPPAEAFAEVTQVPKTLERCNDDPEGYTPAFSWHFVATHVEPGDVVVDRGTVFIVNRPGVRYRDIADTFGVRTSLTVQSQGCPGWSSER